MAMTPSLPQLDPERQRRFGLAEVIVTSLLNRAVAPVGYDDLRGLAARVQFELARLDEA